MTASCSAWSGGEPNEFGEMIKLQEAKNSVITDSQIYTLGPYDPDLQIAAIETLALLGGTTRPVTAEAAFYSSRTMPPRKA